MKILGISGRLQSGKNTAANFIVGKYLLHYGIVRNNFAITEKGELYISDLYGDTRYDGIIDLNRKEPEFLEFLEQNISPYVKIYSFADPLKQMCIDILGLTYNQCYGTNEDKNTLTNLKWINMPTIPVYDKLEDCNKYMTAREVMQYVGTNIFRTMYNNVWVDATMKKIQSEQPELAIIPDARFPNECDGILQNGGKVLRFTRYIGEATHSSETALDNYTNFSITIDNKNMSIKEQNDAVYNELYKLGYIHAN